MKDTIRSIAKNINVSAATVSRVINGSAPVSEEKRTRILSELNRLGYVRTKSSRKNTARNIGFLMLPGGMTDFTTRMLKLQEIAGRLPHKWNLILLPPEIHPIELESRFLKHELAGLLLSGHHVSRELEEILPRIPHVWLNSYHQRENDKTILMGNEFAGRIAARYLLQKKCRKPAVMTAKSVNPGFDSRIEGFRFECFSNKKNCQCLELHIPESFEGFETCTEEELDRSFSAFLSEKNLYGTDGLFCPEEKLTALLHRAITRMKIKKWPKIISCNHTPEYFTGLYPRPASIDLGPRMLAGLGLDELIRRISGEPKRADNIAVLVTPQLIPGD